MAQLEQIHRHQDGQQVHGEVLEKSKSEYFHLSKLTQPT